MEKVGLSIDHFLENYGLKNQIKNNQFLFLWEKVVGPHISRYTRPVTIKDKKLLIETSDSNWSYHLTLLKEKIIRDFNALSNSEVIKDIRFINADFKNEEKEEKVEKDKAFLKQIKKTVANAPKGQVLDEKEAEKLKKALQLSPEYFRNQLERLFINASLQQQWKTIKGAEPCEGCGELFFRETMKGALCPFCLKQVKEWNKLLKKIFCSTPWLKYEKIVEKHPLLDYNIFQICKKKFIERQKKRILKILHNERHKKSRKTKVLKRLSQRYILLVAEKEPAAITEGDINQALKNFSAFFPVINSVL